MASLLTTYEPTMNNKREKEELKIIREIKAIKEVTIVKADKMPHIIALDKLTYQRKMEEFIQKSGCIREQTDLTKKLENQVRRILLRKDTPEFLRDAKPPLFCTAPLMFGTAKTHKEGIQIRAMVLRGTHPLVNVEKSLLKEFGHLINKHQYRIQSSEHMVEQLNRIDWEGGDKELYKFDVESLYPNTDMTKAIGVMRKLIIEQEKYNSTEITNINDLLRLLLESRYFSYNNVIYTQTKGVPMGGTISGMLAELILQEGENRILKSKPQRLISFYRYGDDALVIWENGKIENEVKETVERRDETEDLRNTETDSNIMAYNKSIEECNTEWQHRRNR